MSDDIDELRAQIDRVNLMIRDMLQLRARVAATIADLKHMEGLPGPDPEREAEMLAAVLADAPEGFDEATLRRLFETIFAASRELVVSRYGP